MPYIGKEPEHGRFAQLDQINGTFNGSNVTFNLTVDSVAVYPTNPQTLLISLGGVLQQPVTAYTVSAATMTFTSAPPAAGTFFGVLLGDVLDIGVPSDGTVTVSKMAVNSVDSDQYVDGSIDLVHMSVNSIDSDQYVDGSIDGVHIDNNVIDSQHYAAASIDNEHLADNAVDSAELAAGAVDLAHMSANSVDSDQYLNGSIDTVHIANSQVTLAKIANQAANTVLVRDANSLGVVSAKAVGDTQILIGDGTGFTVASLTGDVTMANSGAVTIAAGAVDIAMLSASQTASSSTFLRGDNSWRAVTLTTIDTNADNRIITGSDTADTLNGETNLMYDGNVLHVKNAGTASSIQLHCEVSNIHYVALKSPAHSTFTGGSWTLTLPGIDGTSGQFLQTNGSGVTSWAAGGAVTREGGNTTEATTTSTSQADILASSSLTVQATEPFYFIFNARKTAGAVTAAALQLKVNSTSLNTVGGPGGTTDLWSTSSTNQAENGVVAIFTGSRVTNYQAPMTAVRGVYPSVAGIGTIDFTNVTEMIRSAVIPIAEITALTVIGLTDSASITFGVDEAHVYSYAAS